MDITTTYWGLKGGSDGFRPLSKRAGTYWHHDRRLEDMDAGARFYVPIGFSR